MSEVFWADENMPPGFPELDRALAGFRRGELNVIMGSTQKPGPKWDLENLTVDCSVPPRGPLEMGQVLQAYRDGWIIICGT